MNRDTFFQFLKQIEWVKPKKFFSILFGTALIVTCLVAGQFVSNKFLQQGFTEVVLLLEKIKF